MSVPNLASLLEHRSDQAALIIGDQSVSHGELADRVARWRGGLIAAGVSAGDRVVVLGLNNETLVTAHLAILGIGAVSVPLNPQSPPAELARELAMVEPSVTVADTHSSQAMAAAISAIGASSIRQLDPEELEAGDPAPVVSVEPGSPAVLLFTSGTGGPPKPAVLTHANLIAGLRAVLSLPVDLAGYPHVFIGVIPLFHVFGLNMVLHLSLATGATLVLADFDGPAETLALIETNKVTVVAGPPTLWRAFTRVPGASRETMASVLLAVSGAAKLPPQLKLDVLEQLGVDLDEGLSLIHI